MRKCGRPPTPDAARLQATNGSRLGVKAAAPLGERKPFSVSDLNTAFAEQDGRISPDGKWIAYTSFESGAIEIYIKPFPAGAGKWEVTTASGLNPMWRGDGRELYFIDPGGILTSVDFAVENAMPRLGTPHALFRITPSGVGSTAFTVTADGKRFIANSASEGGTSRPLTLITNWTADLKR